MAPTVWAVIRYVENLKTGISIRENAKQAMTVRGQVIHREGSSKVGFIMTVCNDGFADAQINLNNSSFRLTGQVVSLEDADVIMGKTNF